MFFRDLDFGVLAMYGYTMYRYNMDGRCSPMETLNRTLIFIRSRALSLSLSFSLSLSLSLSPSLWERVCVCISRTQQVESTGALS